MRLPPALFSRTLRALESDRFRRPWIGFLVCAVLIAAWITWAFIARITLYEPSRSARVEAEAVVHPVDARVEGRVVASRLELGRSVTAGEVLVEIDDRALKLRLTEEHARRDGLEPQLTALRAQLAAAQQALEGERTLGVAVSAETNADARSVEAVAKYAADSAQRAKQLAQRGVVTTDESQKATVEAERLRSSLEASKHRERRMRLDQRTREADQLARIEGLNKDIFDLESRIATEDKAIERLEYELYEGTVRAPISGKIAEVVQLPPGSIIRAGMHLGAIVPSGALRIVAEFTPHSALGRIKPGQPARMRLDSFPWLEHGMVLATVRSIASEAQRGTLRAELEIDRAQQSTIPLEHGLLGSVEVAVEEVSPATLILRAAGDVLRSSESQAPPAPPSERAEPAT